jgi:hypothetical protein
MGAILAIALIVTLGLLTDEVFRIEHDLEAYLSDAADGAITIPADLASDGLAVYVPLPLDPAPAERSTGHPEVFLHLRNTDPSHALRIKSIRAFDATGEERAALIDAPFGLGAMATKQLRIGGPEGPAGRAPSSAIVEWSSAGEVNPPVFEASGNTPRGRTFHSRGIPIGRH